MDTPNAHRVRSRGAIRVNVAIALVIAMLVGIICSEMYHGIYRSAFTDQFRIELPVRSGSRFTEDELALIRPAVCARLARRRTIAEEARDYAQRIRQTEPSTDPAQAQVHLEEFAVAQVHATEAVEAFEDVRNIALYAFKDPETLGCP